jgi:integrase
MPKETERIFPYKTKFYARKTFMNMRKRIAHKLGNPRILQIHFHIFRHWKATMEYRETTAILHVMRLLGHRSITNTLVYTQLINVQDDDYVCKAAMNALRAD